MQPHPALRRIAIDLGAKSQNRIFMNKSLIVTIALLAISSLQDIATAADLFDAPGPGYHQQIERVFPAKDRTISIRVEAPTIRVSSLRDESLLSQPIRLTLGGTIPAATKTGQ
jgi:hypothetical protein